MTGHDFSAFLRSRAEEAAAASVHHASLSQQFLTLAQKYSALAEQAANGHAAGLAESVRQLEREANSGEPAGPLSVAQQAMAVSGMAGHVLPPRPHLAVPPSGSGFRVDPQTPGAVTSSGLSGVPEQNGNPESAAFFSPPARFSAAPDRVSETLEAAGRSSPEIAASDVNSKAVPPANEPTDALDGTKTGLTSQASAGERRRQIRQRRLSIRKLLERARIAALERAERVRIRARKADLQPQIRKTSEEITRELRKSRVPASISTIVTVLALILLAMKQLEFVVPAELPPIVAGFSESSEPVEESLPVEPPAPEIGEQLEQPVEEMPEEMPPEPEPPEPTESVPPPEVPEPEQLMTAELDLPESPVGTVASNPENSKPAPGDVNHRSEAGRQLMVKKYGGSAASESAVGLALEWLAARQRINGTWDFIDVGPCTNPGTVNNPIGGTAYALLPFLAAGQTHREGAYRKRIQAALDFLLTVGVRAPAGYDLRGVVNKADTDEDPNYAYYVHGAATLAICEAYGMTKDRKLKPAAEEAVRFLVNSQDPRGGGWRYNPQQPGSTSATSIQLMALKAAEKAGIRIPDQTWKGISYYLDSVSIDREGRYGYEIEKKSYEISVTAMALLSRMYLGWGRNDGDLRAGVALIDKRGPYENLYYSYFATQVMKNWGGREWERWNGRLRDDLVAWQEKEGDARGSWAPRDRADCSRAGGRLLTTCLSTLTLEVYYRYQPLLKDEDPAAASATTILR